MQFDDPNLRIAYLEARVAALEEALTRRSTLVRQLQTQLEPQDLLRWSRLVHGLPLLPRHAYDLTLWSETTELTPAEVDATLRDLWSSLALATPPPAEAG
ncbi:MAG: hypothetical protein HC897_10825 [Thermoanaerobaculia bacterium]|nr:hypothetical protein [Thermoanaerobaculia bacterium]